MTVVAGVDLSLTSTGLALATVVADHGKPGATQELVASASDGFIVHKTIETKCVSSAGKTADSLRQRNARQFRIADEILEFIGKADLVVIEQLFNSKTNAGGLLDRCGAWWRVVDSVLYHDVPVVAVVASSAKKFLTGSGSADKGTMVRWAGKLWPDWEPSTPSKSEDEADAIALASIGTALLDLAPFEIPDYRAQVLDKLKGQLV